MKISLHRWRCPRCLSGILAPERARKNDIRRYCIPCSSRTGKLVERACMVRERRKAKKKARRRARDPRPGAAVRAAPRATPPFDLEEAFEKYRHLGAWGQVLAPSLTLRRSDRFVHSSGHAITHPQAFGRIVITAGSDPADAHATLIHELAHVATPTSHHGKPWRAIFTDAAYELTGELVLGRPNARKLQDTIREMIRRSWAKGDK